MNISTSETEPFVLRSFDLTIVCPTNLFGSPEIGSIITTSLLKKFAEDGFSKNPSKSTIFGVTPYKTLKRILKDSSVPFDS